MIALDATLRQHPDDETVATLIARIHRELGKAVVADVDTIAAAITADDRLSHLTPTAVTRTFGALLNGAAFLPFDVRQEGLARLAAWLIQADITLYYFMPTAFRQFMHTLSRTQTLVEEAGHAW